MVKLKYLFFSINKSMAIVIVFIVLLLLEADLLFKNRVIETGYFISFSYKNTRFGNATYVKFKDERGMIGFARKDNTFLGLKEGDEITLIKETSNILNRVTYRVIEQ